MVVHNNVIIPLEFAIISLIVTQSLVISSLCNVWISKQSHYLLEADFSLCGTVCWWPRGNHSSTKVLRYLLAFLNYYMFETWFCHIKNLLIMQRIRLDVGMRGDLCLKHTIISSIFIDSYEAICFTHFIWKCASMVS